MERLLPIDVDSASLPVRLRGYDRRAVDSLLTRASSEMERLRTEVQEARRMADQALTELERHRAQEDTLRETLLMAQRAADDTRAAARREAEALVDAARRTHADARRDAELEVQELRWEIDRLQRERESLAFRIRGVLDETARILERDAHTARTTPTLGLVNGTAEGCEPDAPAESDPVDAVG